MNENTEELLRIIEGLVMDNAQLEKENMELKKENSGLRKQLVIWKP